MLLNDIKTTYKPLLILSSLPFLFIFGKALSNSVSVIIAMYGIYLVISKNYLKFLKYNFLKLYIFFLLCLFVSSIASFDIFESLNTTMPYSFFLFFIVSHLFILETYEKTYLEQFLLFSYLSLIIVIGFSFYEFFFIQKTNDQLISYYVREDGLTSIFSYKILGNYMQKFLPIFIGIKIYLKKKLSKLDLFIIISGVVITFLSYSRTSIILLILFSILFYILFFDISKDLIKLLAICSIIIFSSLPFTNIYQKVVIKTFDQVYFANSFNLYPKHYIGHYKTALNMIIDKPYLGTGPDTFKELCSNNKYEFIYHTFYDENNLLVNLNSCSTHPHNYFLQNFAESGLLTFALLCLFYLFILKEFINFFISDNKLAKNPLYKISIITILCNFFPFAPSTDFYNTHINTLIYLPIIFFIYFKYIKKYT